MTAPPETAQAAAEVVGRVRDWLETVWPSPEDPDDLPSRDTCGPSSAVLLAALLDEIPGDWRIAGGAEDVRDPMNRDDLVPEAPRTSATR
jgi:hypothetical protein